MAKGRILFILTQLGTYLLNVGMFTKPTQIVRRLSIENSSQLNLFDYFSKTQTTRVMQQNPIDRKLNNHLLKQVGSNNGLKVRIRVDLTTRR